MDHELKKHLNRPRQLCFIKDCQLKTVTNGTLQSYYIEVLLEIKHDGKFYTKLAYVGKEAYAKCIRDIRPGLNAEVIGKHMRNIPFETSNTQFLSDLGIFKITDITFFQNRFTGELETKEDVLRMEKRKKQKRANKQKADKDHR